MLFANSNIYFLLFALSGFSGLIYESIWTHYLKLFLGHAAYAQTLVLAIFMGGMAIGSWICCKYSLRWKNLLLGYAFAEGIIGICALLFHFTFSQTIDLSYTTILPMLGNPVAASIFKWVLSALMILPQTILLGMTFPLMSSGVLRLFPDKPGKSIGMLYFTNSMGAAVGVLVSGFLLIRSIGLPGTIALAGVINIALALIVWSLNRNLTIPLEQQTVVKEASSPLADVKWYRFFLIVSMLTGTASFIYEIGWIRMLCLVLGTSTHAFELMLSAFILGLAFGGLWIQQRIDNISSPVRYLAQVQVVMGMLALSTLLLYGNTFEIMQWLIKTLPATNNGYVLFNLSNITIAIAIMFPTTFCAGMTLPLITYLLLKQRQGERSIGAVYTANTIGAIIGVFFAIHIGMPFLGLKGLITSGASLDLILGIALICYVARESGSYRLSYVLSTIGMCGIVGTILFVNLDSYKMGSGVYRLGILDSPNNVKLLFHKDGKTATVSNFLSKDGGMSIRTNGKIDAAVMTTPGAEAHPDESTMMLTGVIPMTLHPSAKTAACIGLGSGITSNTILSNPSIQQLDTIEIEKAMIEGAKFFRPRVELVYTDPRSRIYNDDAKTFFSTYNKKYDLIVSEPSNPWVSGVAGLFSEEFYRLIKHHLNDDGMFVQWVQLYEINVDLVVSVLKAVALNFPDYAVYATNNSDMVIVAKKKGLLKQPDYSILKSPTLANDLKRIHINNGQDIAIRMIGSKRFLQNFLESYSIRPNSDYYPILDQNAARTRFLNESADSFTYFSHSMVPVLEMLDKSTLIHNQTNISPSPYFDNSKEAFIAMKLRDYFLLGKYTPLTGLTDLMQMAQFLKQSCDGNINISQNERLAIVHSLTITMTPYLSPSELDSFWILLESGACFKHKTPKEQQFYKLFESIGNRNASQMLESARTLLQSSDDLSPKVRHYLLVSGMLGALANGNRAEANRLWTLYKSQISGSIETDLLVRLLVAESRVN